MKQKFKAIDSNKLAVVKVYDRVVTRFVIDQKDESVLLHIKTLFGFGSVNKAGDSGVFRYTNGSIKNNSVTIEYYNLFTLKTKKREAFLKWSDIRQKILAKEHLTPAGLEIIRELAKSINNNVS